MCRMKGVGDFDLRWIQMCRVDDVDWIQRVSEFQPNEVYSLYTNEIENR